MKGLSIKFSRWTSGFVVFFALSSLFLLTSFVHSAETKDKEQKKAEAAGEFFGIPVPISNYYFAQGIIRIFGTRWRGEPKTDQEIEKEVWNELLLSYEAFRRGINVSRTESEEEITKMLKSYNVSFDWKKDPETYTKWAKDTLGYKTDLFENQIEHLLKVEKLRKQVIDSIKVSVTEEEAHQKFLNEYNTLSLELVQSDELKKAQEFYEQVNKDSDYWEKNQQLCEETVKKDTEYWQRNNDKNPGPGGVFRFQRPGFVCVEFLMNMWGYPQDAVYRMLELPVGSFYKPVPVYKGYGVSKILEIRKADENEFPKRRQSYYERVEMIKKYEGFPKWLEDLRKSAHIKSYLEIVKQSGKK
ncbi:MAG: hypothetical protein V2A65_05030 [Candidatus Omnitrophota bacterium]